MDDSFEVTAPDEDTEEEEEWNLASLVLNLGAEFTGIAVDTEVIFQFTLQRMEKVW